MPQISPLESPSPHAAATMVGAPVWPTGPATSPLNQHDGRPVACVHTYGARTVFAPSSEPRQPGRCTAGIFDQYTPNAAPMTTVCCAGRTTIRNTGPSACPLPSRGSRSIHDNSGRLSDTSVSNSVSLLAKQWSSPSVPCARHHMSGRSASRTHRPAPASDTDQTPPLWAATSTLPPAVNRMSFTIPARHASRSGRYAIAWLSA